MNYIRKLAALAKENGGIIETKIAAQHGISKAMLYQLCRAGKIQRIIKGQYIFPDDMQDELLSISCLAQKKSFFSTIQRFFFMRFLNEHPLCTP
mgnify:CR=1 FL=1